MEEVKALVTVPHWFNALDYTIKELFLEFLFGLQFFLPGSLCEEPPNKLLLYETTWNVLTILHLFIKLNDYPKGIIIFFVEYQSTQLEFAITTYWAALDLPGISHVSEWTHDGVEYELNQRLFLYVCHKADLLTDLQELKALENF